MNFSVLIPTYKRAKDLERCLAALLKQSLLPTEAIVVVRDEDLETQRLVQAREEAFGRRGVALTEVRIGVPGVVAAMNKGLAGCHTELLAITDDDAEPHPDWLERMHAHFRADGDVAGVGGRDIIMHARGASSGAARRIGELTWYGKPIGNHHLGSDGPREVDFLKGVNCAYRTAELKTIGFETRLLGSGAQVHWEMVLGLALRRDGRKLIYDPAIQVDHYESVRHDEDKRQTFVHPVATKNMIHNETYAVLAHLKPVQRVAFWLWAFAVGTTASPGALQTVRYLLRGQTRVLPRTVYCFQGRLLGARSWLHDAK